MRRASWDRERELTLGDLLLFWGLMFLLFVILGSFWVVFWKVLGGGA